MANIRGSDGNDPILVAVPGNTYLGGLGDDTYIIDPNFVQAGDTVTINDTDGANTIRLVGGLEIESSQLQTLGSGVTQAFLTLSNGTNVLINGADSFGYQVGGSNTGDGAVTQTFEELVTDTLGHSGVPAPGASSQVTDPVEIGDAGSFSISAPAEVNEGSTATWTVTRSGDTSVAADVDYTVTREGDTSTADHGDITVDGAVDNSGSGTLSFAAGEASKQISVPFTVDNETPEDGEGVTVTLSNPTNDFALDQSSATVDIVNNPDVYTLTQNTPEVTESETITYTISLLAPAAQDVNVAFTVVPGNASAPNQGSNETNLNDFAEGTFNPKTVTIPAGEQSATFTLSTMDDEITELPEIFYVTATVGGEEVARIESTLLDGNTVGEGQVYTLEDGIDQITGTGFDDIFNAPIDNDSNSFDDFDELDGGAGHDVLNATLYDEDVDGASLQSIEELNLRAVGTSEVDAGDFSGVEEIWSTRTSGEVSGVVISNLGEDVLLGMDRAKGVFEVQYDSGVAPDTQHVTIIDSGTEASDVTFDIQNPSDTMAIESQGDASFLELGDGLEAALTDLTVTGPGDLTLQAPGTSSNFSHLESLDASGMTGALSILVDDGLVATQGSATLDAGSSDGDVLVVSNATNADPDDFDFSNTSGFETLGFATDWAVSGTLDLTDEDGDPVGFDSVVFFGDVTGGSDLAVEGMESGGLIDFKGDVTLGNFSVDAAGDLEAGFEGSSSFDSVEMDDVTSLDVTLGDGTDADLTIGTLMSDDMETLAVAGGPGGTTDGLDVTFGDGTDGVESLTTVNLTGFDGTVNINAENADFDSGNQVTVQIGDGVETFNYSADTEDDSNDTNREIFQFHGDDIGDIGIENFNSGVGGNADRLDFSQFDGADSLDDLKISYDGTDTTIESDNDSFDGTITVKGVDLSDDAANFIFS